MADIDLAAPIKALEKFFEERQSVVSKERELVQKLGSVLQRMGYQIIRVGAAGMPAMPRRRGRPPKNEQAMLAAGAAPAAPVVKRRRGRPPKSAKAGSPSAKRRGRAMAA